MILKNNLYILTGGPGSGKTTLIEQLKGMGYGCMSEVGRKIIKEQLAAGGAALPWSDVAGYAHLMLHYSIHDYLHVSGDGDVCFFDRGIPDVLGYTELIGLPNRQEFVDSVAGFRYNPTVFILPPWEQIYQTDSERKQDFELATRTYQAMKEVYTMYDYRLVEVPCLPVAERAAFILNRIESNSEKAYEEHSR